MKKYRSTGWIFLGILMLCCIASCGQKKDQEEVWNQSDEPDAGKRNAGICAAFEESLFDSGIISSDVRVINLSKEERAASVYTFLQGPRAYREGIPWSGSWCERIVGYNSFGGFGCGLCCMANIYCTMSGYECSPWDMYNFAISKSFYYPSKESGAIGWTDMRMALSAAGIFCDLYRKPETYEEFKEQMKQAKSAVVLVSSANDDTFWKDTPGHYVYDALKTVSQYQYLAVTKYSEGANVWKWDKIDDVWNGKFFGIN